MKAQVAVFISGRGSNLKSLIEACQQQEYPAEIALVVSNRGMAEGLEHASAAGIPSLVVPFTDKAHFHNTVQAELTARQVDIIALAGFMRILDETFVNRWAPNIINIHPSLLPMFPGLHPQRQAIEAGVTVSGCTVHWVVPDVDAGPVLVQAFVPIKEWDDEASLTAKILQEEHKLYPVALRYVAGQVVISRNK